MTLGLIIWASVGPILAFVVGIVVGSLADDEVDDAPVLDGRRGCPLAPTLRPIGQFAGGPRRVSACDVLHTTVPGWPPARPAPTTSVTGEWP